MVINNYVLKKKNQEYSLESYSVVTTISPTLEKTQTYLHTLLTSLPFPFHNTPAKQLPNHTSNLEWLFLSET